MTHAQIATDFLTLASSSKVAEAYESCIHPGFTHHNPFFAGDRASLMRAMQESALNFPNKEFEVVRTIEQGDFVLVHGKIRLSPEMPQLSLMHIFRFADDLIIEEWEAVQEVPMDGLNTNGTF